MAEEKLVINSEDELLHIPRCDDPVSTLSEYAPTNAPLSQSQMDLYEARDAKHEGWGPRTTKNIGDVVPLPDKPAPG
jgi:hypothetical protein